MSNPVTKRDGQRLKLRALRAELRVLKGRIDRLSDEIVKGCQRVNEIEDEKHDALTRQRQVLLEIAEMENKA